MNRFYRSLLQNLPPVLVQILPLLLISVVVLPLAFKVPVKAQSVAPDSVPSPSLLEDAWTNQIRARNLARQAAENANGGLQNYSAQVEMHTTTDLAPVTDEGGQWRFIVLGRFPEDPPTVYSLETEVLVRKDFNTIEVVYNGPRRN